MERYRKNTVNLVELIAAFAQPRLNSFVDSEWSLARRQKVTGDFFYFLENKDFLLYRSVVICNHRLFGERSIIISSSRQKLRNLELHFVDKHLMNLYRRFHRDPTIGFCVALV